MSKRGKPRGEAAAFCHLRRRLTFLCTLATGVIFVGMAITGLSFAQNQLASRGEAAFQGNVNAILFHMRSQKMLDHTWMAQTEASGDLILSVELSGTPVLYRGPVGGEVRESRVVQARKLALQEYGFDLSSQPVTDTLGRQENLYFRDSTGQECRAVAATIPMKKGWMGLLIVQSLLYEKQELGVQRVAFGTFTVLAVALLAVFSHIFICRAMRPVEESRRRQAEFISAASHELRAPLAVIQTCLSAIRGSPTEKVEHFTAMADSECVRMSRLVGDMLALASSDSDAWSMQPEEVEAETLLLEVCEAFEPTAHEKGIHLTATLSDGPLPRCTWDRQRVSQVLSVLLGNALSHTPREGRIFLKAEGVGEAVRLIVSDSGPGIPEGERERIFQRFYRADSARTDREHYGLGLCIAREIALLHSGDILVTDTPGGGATFTVTLPIKP